ncbi:MAG: cytochrome c family protein [Sphingomonas sp.]|nr:cytochrome c family protein [Sphingomonas sp.]
MDDRFNTIAGWVLGAGIVLLGSTLVTGQVFKSERPETMGYPIEGVEEESSGAADAEPPIAHFLQTADAARGEGAFRKCAACHTINQGGANGLGPNLYGVMGEAVGTGHAGFNFSDALRSRGGTWDWDTMSAWLASPRTFAPGTRMTFAGLSNPQERADLLLYMNQQGGNLQLPPPPAVEEPAAEAGNEAAPAEGNEAAPAEANAAAPAAE